MITEKILVKEAKELDINRYVVGAIVLRDSKILLLERPKDDFMGGIYELPSGKVEKGETLNVALAREVEEETGLTIESIIRYVGHFDYESKSGKKTRQFNFLVTVEPPLRIKLEEHSGYAWADANQLDKYPITENVSQIIDISMIKPISLGPYKMIE